MIQRTHSAPVRWSPRRAWFTILWWRVSSRGTEIWASPLQTAMRECSAGQPVLSSLKKSCKPYARLTARAGTWWWACPMPAASGAAARARSAPCAESTFAIWVNKLADIYTSTQTDTHSFFSTCHAFKTFFIELNYCELFNLFFVWIVRKGLPCVLNVYNLFYGYKWTALIISLEPSSFVLSNNCHTHCNKRFSASVDCWYFALLPF